MSSKRKILSRSISTAPLLAVLSLQTLGDRALPAQSAGTWNKRGQTAEVREDYDTAFEAYRQAHAKKPADIRYKERFERLRFQAAVAHVDRGRVLKQSGDLGGAMQEFVRAHEIDAGNQTADQEIRLLQTPGQFQPVPSVIQPGRAAAVPVPATVDGDASPTAATVEAGSQFGDVAGPITLQPVSNDPITIHSVEDTRNIYQAIGKLAGLNVLFDPNYTSKRIPIDLTNVSLADALRIVGIQAGTFYKPVTPNTIFIAQNTRTNRTDLDDLAVQTFYLTNASQQNDANEILTAIRNLLDPSVKIYLVPSQNAIVMRATPDQLLLAQKLLNDLDRARSEVVVDVAILSVNRDKVRKLGITLPQSFGLTPTTTSTSTANSTPTTGTGIGTGTGTGTTPGTNITTSNLTLNNLANLSANNFAVSVTGGTVDALLTDADTRILQNPRVRATDGQKATLKMGTRVPIATGSYNAGVSTGIASIGVQTQFTYIDVGVNVDMTPTVHYDRQITLKMKLEVSAVQSNVTISNVTEPIIGQNIVEQTIQLREGEPSILAGMVQKQDVKTLSGTPGLGEIPIIKYFFASQNKEAQQSEIVFLLIPHIVRESVLTRMNTRPIDTGSGQSIELRHDPNAIALNVPVIPRPRAADAGQTSAAVAASAMVGQLSQQAQMPTPGQATPAFNSGTAGTSPAVQAGTLPVSLTIVPPSAVQAVGSTFQVAVMAKDAKDLYSLPLQLKFNSQVLQLVNVDSGDLLSRDGQAVATVHRDEGNGLVNVSTSRPPGVKGVEGQGSICVLTFKALAAGDSSISLPKVGARNSLQATLPTVGSTAVVHVK